MSKRTVMYLLGFGLMLLLLGLLPYLFPPKTEALAHFSHPMNRVDMSIVAWIESRGNTYALNPVNSEKGLFQISPICLKEYNNFNPYEYVSPGALYDPISNYKVANWYMNIRIPQMLGFYNIEDTTENRLIAYNAGIKTLINGRALTPTTKNYLKQYNSKKGR